MTSLSHSTTKTQQYSAQPGQTHHNGLNGSRSGASDGALGTIANNSSPPPPTNQQKPCFEQESGSCDGECSCNQAEPDPRQAQRFYLQSLAAKLLPGERVSKCLRMLVPGSDEVEIHHSERRQAAHYRQLQVCGSPWHCAVCAARISEQRRKELQIAINTTGLHAILITFTLQHNIHDDLQSLVDDLMNAYGDFKSGAPWQRLRDEFFWFGDIRNLETTYGDENGWHPHIHVLWFTTQPLDTFQMGAFEERMKKRWAAKLDKYGRDCSWAHGVDIRAGNQYLAEYISKFGRVPVANKDPVSGKWTVVHELTKSVSKIGKVDGRTPLQLLMDYGEGDKQAGALFVEYAKVFKGRRQLEWSRGLKKVLRIGEVADEEAAEDSQADAEYLTSISRVEWWRFLQLPRDRRGELLEVARAGDAEAVHLWLADLLYPQQDKVPKGDSHGETKAGWSATANRQRISGQTSPVVGAVHRPMP